MTTPAAARDGETMPTVSGGQHGRTSWHPADAVPQGRNHGAAGICVGADGRDLVLISPDGVYWGFPAGRPEGAETLEETLVTRISMRALAQAGIGRHR